MCVLATIRTLHHLQMSLSVLTGPPASLVLNAMCHMSGNQRAASVETRRAETADSSCICRTRRRCGMTDTVDVVISFFFFFWRGREYFPDAVRHKMLRSQRATGSPRL